MQFKAGLITLGFCSFVKSRWLLKEPLLSCGVVLLLGGLLGLLGQKDGLDVGQHTALSDGHSA